VGISCVERGAKEVGGGCVFFSVFLYENEFSSSFKGLHEIVRVCREKEG
jgi:hypothetical protein